MVYIPTDPHAMLPGLPGNASAWSFLLSNVDEAAVDYAPTLMDCLVDIQVDVTSAQLVAEWVLDANEDQVPIATTIRWASGTHKGYAYVAITDGVNTDTSATAEIETATWTTTTITTTPSSSSGPRRYVRLYLFSSDAGQRVKLGAVCSYFAPSTPPSDEQPSGFRPIGDWVGASLAVPSEVAARASNNTRALARDRRATLAGGLGSSDDLSDPLAGPAYEVTGEEWVLVERWIHPSSDVGRRPYDVHVKVSGDKPEWKLSIGGQVVTGSDDGWHHESFVAALPEGTPGYLYLRSDDDLDAKLHTWQLVRGLP